MLAVCAALTATSMLTAPSVAQAQAPAIASAPAGGFRVIPLVRDDRVLVSLDLADGFTSAVRAAIKSGLKTVFTYELELRLDVPGWVDRTIGTATITTNVEYDNLSRVYTVTRMLDGRAEQSNETDSEATVRQLMTNLVRVPVFRTSLLEPNREYYVRVRATARPTNGSLLWPFGSGTSAMGKFTFLR